mmetsp:Transcript_152615/g.487665  ORF Transcript_152615/g.487665 Transcript_152615/m.487665 type:complete len:719 (+) Transcript_152615:94-2250(+)
MAPITGTLSAHMPTHAAPLQTQAVQARAWQAPSGTEKAALPESSSGARQPAVALASVAAAVVGGVAAKANRRRRRSSAFALTVVRGVDAGRHGASRIAARSVAVGAGLTRISPDEYIREDIRNIAIIAHVDHGKTTLSNNLMKQTRGKEEAALASMDSNVLEAERGITILAKNAALEYKGVKINLIDTPGHADFGGEVERILNMADACVLLVDAQEGPMPQTKFVLKLAIKLNKKVLVCINKVDKPNARPSWVLDTTFDLFASLGACDEQCDFPVSYASGFLGKASVEGPDKLQDDLMPLLDQILEQCPKPIAKADMPLQMLVSNLDYDDHLGRVCIGRIVSGSLKVGQEIGIKYGEVGTMRTTKISKLYEFNNNGRREINEVLAGDICAFTGSDKDVVIGDTVVDPKDPRPLPPIEVQEPTVELEFGPNCSPLANKDINTKWVTSAHIRARLEKECLTNLALRFSPDGNENFKVKGRGTLQLGILLENMRREGFEMMVGAPQVLTRKDPETKKVEEPWEEATIETPDEYQNDIMEELLRVGGELQNMGDGSMKGLTQLIFHIPTKMLIGMQNKLMMMSRGQAMLSAQFLRWGVYKSGDYKAREQGSIANSAEGEANHFSLGKMGKFGGFFVEHGTPVYPGMVVGINNKAENIEVNIAKGKGSDNMRNKNKETAETVSPVIRMGIDEYLGWMDTDEKLEVTPGALRLVKCNSKALSAR